jgi:hypothetical protein
LAAAADTASSSASSLSAWFSRSGSDFAIGSVANVSHLLTTELYAPPENRGFYS